ncbi:reverse transcriptase domain-containing protein [Tanacetum coccineum]
MPFALKNVEATYQWLIDKVFNNQIRRNLKAYVNDMVIKSMSEEDMLIDTQGTFDKLQAINMKLNPKKCSFGIEEGETESQWEVSIFKQIPLKRHKEGHLKIEGVYRDIANAYNLNQKRSVGNVSRSLDGKHQRRLAHRKRKKTSSYLLRDYEEGLMLVSPKEKEYTYAFRFKFETTNNEAKYEMLLAGLRIAVDMKVRDLSIFVDSQIVANQVNGLFEARQPVIKQYLDKTKEVLKSLIVIPWSMLDVIIKRNLLP